MTLTIRTRGPDETERVGEALGRSAVPGLVVALQGPLGAGKTVLTKGIARGLEVPNARYVTSPTFTIHKSYRGRLELDHLDFYRLGAAGELEDLGLEEILFGSGVCVVEWPDSFFRELPADRVTVRIQVLSPEDRLLELQPQGDRSLTVCRLLRDLLGAAIAREDQHEV